MNKKTTYVRARFTASQHDSYIQAFLIGHDPLGFLEEDDWWEVYFSSQIWHEVKRDLHAMLERHEFNPEFTATEFDQENWNQQWEESIQPIQITENMLITPSWHTASDSPDTLQLIIDPKMSFGTGYHATTRLMLRLLEGQVREGDIVLDVGTGTGVLAIAAVKMGAQRGDGVDTDEWSYDNAVENAQRNLVDTQTRFYHGSIEHAHGPYDILLSNITKIDNLEMLPRFDDLLNSGGRLILSGFLSSDVEDLRDAIEHLGLNFLEEIQEDEWSALLARKGD